MSGASFFSDLDAVRREARSRGEAARLLAEGDEAPQEGRCYTLSPDFVCGDRSWTDAIWRVRKVNNGHALAEWVGGSKPYGEPTRLMQIAERAWYPADELAAEWARLNPEPQP